MTTHICQPPAALTRYLRRATFGLSPERRDQVWNELEEHLLCRAEQLEGQGCTAELALDRALRELGPPLRVSAGMNGVHNMPKLIAFGTLGLLAVSATFYALAQTPNTEVPVLTTAPGVICVRTAEAQPHLPVLARPNNKTCYQDDRQTTEGLYIGLSELGKQLQKLGLRAEVQPQSGQIDFHYLGRPVTSLYPAFRRAGETYLAVGDLFSALMSGFPIPVVVQGSEHPVFTVGTLGHWSLKSADGQTAQAIYSSLSQQAAFSLYDFSKGNTRWSVRFTPPEPTLPKRTVQTGLRPGEVVTAYRWSRQQPNTTADGTAFQEQQVVLSSGTVDAQSNVKLSLPADAQFVNAAPTQPGNEVLLVKLTGTPLQNLPSGIVVP